MSNQLSNQIRDDLACRTAEPRWPAVVAVLAISAIHYALPNRLTLGGAWALPSVAVPLLIPTSILHRLGNHNWNRVFGISVSAVVTGFVLVAVARVVGEMLQAHQQTHEEAVKILQSAALLWLANVLVFALWYWRLDAGGPHQRDLAGEHVNGGFLFPQMVLSDEQRIETGNVNWSPGFVDYLFLAFNTSTALSPADTPALAQWAKLLMMLQSLISLSIIVLMAARAVNTL